MSNSYVFLMGMHFDLQTEEEIVRAKAIAARDERAEVHVDPVSKKTRLYSVASSAEMDAWHTEIEEGGQAK